MNYREMKEPSASRTVAGRPWSAAVLVEVISDVEGEFLRSAHQAPFASAHEAVAKIEEEFLEFRREVYERKREETDWDGRREEALHIAAVALKFLIEFRQAGKEAGE